jgi:hypothetical protein
MDLVVQKEKEKEKENLRGTYAYMKCTEVTTALAPLAPDKIAPPMHDKIFAWLSGMQKSHPPLRPWPR